MLTFITLDTILKNVKQSQCLLLQKRTIRALWGQKSTKSCRRYFILEEIQTIPLYILTCLNYEHCNQHIFLKKSSNHIYTHTNSTSPNQLNSAGSGLLESQSVQQCARRSKNKNFKIVYKVLEEGALTVIMLFSYYFNQV